MTEQTYTRATAGAVSAEVTSRVGRIAVVVDATATHAKVKVHTSDAEGPLADAVRDTTIVDRCGRLRVQVPETAGAAGSIISTGTMRGFRNEITVTGNVGGSMVVSSGDVFIGGRQIVGNGRVVAQQGTVVGGGTITVEVTLPPGSSLTAQTASADLDVRGALHELDVRSVSGDVEAQCVHTFRCNTTSGDVEIERITGSVNATGVSGDIEIGTYSGSSFYANTVSGDVMVSATPNSSGTLFANTVSGDVTTRGAGHLETRTHTVSGRERRR